MKRKLIILGLIITACLTVTAETVVMTPSTVGYQWYSSLDEGEQAAFLIGYITANWVWSTGLYDSQSYEDFTDPVRHIYRLLAPATTTSWQELDAAIERHYADHPDSELTLWMVIHEWADEFRSTGGKL